MNRQLKRAGFQPLHRLKAHPSAKVLPEPGSHGWQTAHHVKTNSEILARGFTTCGNTPANCGPATIDRCIHRICANTGKLHGEHANFTHGSDIGLGVTVKMPEKRLKGVISMRILHYMHKAQAIHGSYK